MRLLNVKTHHLESFEGRVPEYAILSHRWESEELLFDQVNQPDWPTNLQTLGATKVLQTCRQAESDGFYWIWVDTCCIDKSSSAELSEAINSMFAWYEGSQVCYAYLSDVHRDEDFDRSQWFQRGWTLQELIAPYSVRFFNANWNLIGTRSVMAARVSRITGIRLPMLKRGEWEPGRDIRHDYTCARDLLAGYNAATRLSWFGKRKTTRVEDATYCLLGLFDIKMPLIYGEGKKAFGRLMEIIILEMEDPSLLISSYRRRFNLLEQGPSDYQGSSHLHAIPNKGSKPRARLIASGHHEYTLICHLAPFVELSNPSEEGQTLPDEAVCPDRIAILDISFEDDQSRLGLLLTRKHKLFDFVESPTQLRLRPGKPGLIDCTGIDKDLRPLKFIVREDELQYSNFELKGWSHWRAFPMSPGPHIVVQDLIQPPHLNYTLHGVEWTLEAHNFNMKRTCFILKVSGGDHGGFDILYGYIFQHTYHPRLWRNGGRV